MFSPLPDILADLRQGRMVILTDDECRENEGDLVLPAQFVTAEAITFMLSVARGYLCLSLTEADCDRLRLTPQAAVNTTHRGTAFTVSIDGHPRHGFTTGVSARERAATVRMAIDPAFGPDDFVRPGHINPLRARNGGVLVRTGQTEGSVDLCRLAGLYPAALIIEIMRDDGEMARLPDLVALAKRHNLKLCSVAQIIEHRLAKESLIRRLEPAEGTTIRTTEGEFRLFAYSSVVDPHPHLALTVGEIGVPRDGVVPEVPEPTLVRVHRASLLGDVFCELPGSHEAASGRMLRASMRMIQREGRGAIVYVRHEGMGSTLSDQVARPQPTLREVQQGEEVALQDVPMVERRVGIGSQILRDLGLTRLRLLTNHATEWPALDAYGLEVVERVGVPVEDVSASAPAHCVK